VSVPSSFLQVKTVAAPGVEVVDPGSVDEVVEELLGELLEHAGSNAAIAINTAVETTRCLRTRTTSVPVKMGGTPYIARTIPARSRHLIEIVDSSPRYFRATADS
jgi:hypothetical protein